VERPRASVAAAAFALALATPTTAIAADDAALLARYAPVLVHDSRERFPAAAVQRGAAPDPGRFAAERARKCAARSCDEQGECDGLETALAGGGGAVGLGLLGLVLARRRRLSTRR
jgi:hypothetical protein